MMIGRLLVGVATVLAVLAQGCQTVNRQDADDAFDLAQRYRTERNFDEAIRLCRRAVEIDPANAQVHARLGVLLRDTGRNAEAAEAFRKAWQLDPTLYDARFLIWDSELNDAQWTEEARTKVKGEIDRMLADRERDGRIDEKFLDLVQSAYRMIHPKDDISAIFDFQKYKKYVPAKDQEKMGVEDAFWTARFKEPLAKRVEAFEPFVEQYPNSEEWTLAAYTWMLNAYKEGDLVNLDKVRKLGEKWVADMPEFPTAWYLVSRTYADAGIEPAKSVQYARTAVDLLGRPERRTRIENEKNDPEIESYRKTLAAFLDNVAWALIRAGDLEGADRAIAEALRHADDFSAVHYHRGLIAEQRGDSTAASAAFGRSLMHAFNKKAQEALAEIIRKSDGDLVALRRQWMTEREGSSVIFDDVTTEAKLVDDKGTPLKFGAIAWGDYDNDGFLDLLFNGCRLYRNDGKGRFEDVTAKCGLSTSEGGAGYWADFDNDGHLDFFILCHGEKSSDRLFRNTGQGTFVDVTEKAGMLEIDPLPGQAAAWGDYDADGFVDLYVANYETRGLPRSRGTPDKLFHNNGNGTFTEVSQAAGTAQPVPQCGRSVSWGDFDNDGDLDLYVGNYRLNRNFLFVNQGNGTFKNEATQRGVEGDEDWADDNRLNPSYFGHTIGAAWGDYDNDGDLDLFCANLAHPRAIQYSDKSMFYRNNGKESGYNFTDIRIGSGIAYEETHSQPAWGDFDNDGFLDLAITSVYETRFSFLYRNRGDGTFSDVTWLTGTRAENGWGCAWADYDNDGHLDLLICSGSGIRLYRNRGGNNMWLKVRLTGAHCNRGAIGARVTVVSGKTLRMREIEGGAGTASQNSSIAQFGLGPFAGPVDVEVRWPCGRRQTVKGIAVNQQIDVTETK